MESVIEVCGDQLVGWYGGIDRLRVGGIFRSLQQPGAVVNFMKRTYPEEDRPLRRFPELTQGLRRGVEKLVLRGVPYLEARRVSDAAVQAWLAPLYEAEPRVGSVVAIVRTIEGVSSFSCRPRKHRAAKGSPRTGQRPVGVAEHHLVRGKHNIAVYYFYLYDQHWGRCSVRIGSYLPFDVSLQLNGHEYLERQMRRQRRTITMASNAVAKVIDWEALRKLSGESLEPAVRRFAAYWLLRLPHGLTPAQIQQLGGYYLYIQALEACRNFVFRSEQQCRPFFESLLRHNQMLGSPDSIRYLFGLSRRPRRVTSGQVTPEKPMGCFKAFYGSNWIKCYDKQGFILRFEIVMNLVTDFVASKSLSNLRYLTRFGQDVCRRMERACLTAVSCPVSAGAYKSLVEPGTDALGRRYPAIRPERPAQQDLLATILSLQHCAKGFSAREIRALHQKKHGATLNPSQASYRLRVLRAHGLIEQVGKRRRYRLSQAGRPIVTFLVKLYTHFLAPVVQAASNGIHRFRAAVAHDPIAQALDEMFRVLGIGTSPLAHA